MPLLRTDDAQRPRAQPSRAQPGASGIHPLASRLRAHPHEPPAQGLRHPAACNPPRAQRACSKGLRPALKGALSKGNRVVFVVPAISLIDQTVRAFLGEGIEGIGVIQADHSMTDAAAAVQVASVQTLQRRALPAADVVVIDEAHRWFALFGSWMADPAWASIPFIGLSATPWAEGLGRHYESLIIAATLGEMIQAGVLSPFRVFAPSTQGESPPPGRDRRRS